MKNEPLEYVTPRRRINSDQFWGTIFFLAVIGCGAWYLINNFQSQARKKHTAEIRQQQTDASIAALALKYHAITNWETSLPDRGIDAQPFSIDISRALNIPLKSDEALDATSNTARTKGFRAPVSELVPVLIKCDLKDIAEKDGEIIASLSSVDTTNNLSLELRCNLFQAETFASTNQFLSFAVVFKGKEVRRLSNSDGDGFSVKGDVVDVVQLP